MRGVTSFVDRLGARLARLTVAPVFSYMAVSRKWLGPPIRPLSNTELSVPTPEDCRLSYKERRLCGSKALAEDEEAYLALGGTGKEDEEPE